MNFPTDIIKKVVISKEIQSCFNIQPIEAFKGKTDYMLIYENEEQVKNIKYDLKKIGQINARGIIITARRKDSHFVSRFFAPQSGIDEDPITGSAHTTLTPYWSKRLNKNELTAVQISKRKGFLICRYKNDRTEISGKARMYMIGEIRL